MGVFGSNEKKDEYDLIYDYDSEDSRNYEELNENESPEEVIERIKGTVGRGTCIYCNTKDTMEYEGTICFICTKCGMSIHEDSYYRWLAGYPIKFEE